jgi:PBP1b-binding outer membrane lipoprotein LpoB
MKTIIIASIVLTLGCASAPAPTPAPSPATAQVPAPVPAPVTQTSPSAPPSPAEVVPPFQTAELIKWDPVPEGTPQGARQHDYDLTHQSIRVRFDRQGAALDHAALGGDQMTA